MQLPQMAKVKQHFPDEYLSDVSGSVKKSLIESGITNIVKPGQRIAISSGSRGISNIQTITRTVVDSVKEIGGKPFILPAMGSHGGATADGQKDVLASYGIDKNSMGCPIEATMDVLEVGKLVDNTPVLLNRLAVEADGVILVNRIKPHTSFRGQFESGLMKMMTIGLGSHQGATIAHSKGAEGLARLIPAWGKTILQKAPILMGIAIVENAYEQTLKIEAISANKFISREPQLLDIARSSMPQIPCEGIDVLIVDQIGKNISGTGMDTNIIGRMLLPGVKEPNVPGASRIVALDLTDESHGNANGVGLSDIITRRLFEKIDFDATYANVFTHTFLNRAHIPIIMESDQKAIEAAINVQRLRDNKEARIVRINNTLDIGEISVSKSVLTEVLSKPGVKLTQELTPIQFDDFGNIL